MNDDKRAFWDDRARRQERSGTDDFILQTLEETELLSRVSEGAHVLDVGCGDGALLRRLATEKSCTGFGLDFSATFVGRCRDASVGLPLEFVQAPMQEVGKVISGTFDVVITKRSLINLDSTEEQFAVIDQLLDLVLPGGLLLMIESTNEGLARLNDLRSRFALPEMTAPWHNHYFNSPQIEQRASAPDVQHYATSDFASTYFILSRVVYAHVAQLRGEELHYDSDINLMALDLPAWGDIGAPRLHSLTRTEKTS